MYIAQVSIHLKKGVSDPEGANTLNALHLLGFSQVNKATTFHTIELVIEETDKKKVEKAVEEMCQRLLTNPVIHDYTITITKP